MTMKGMLQAHSAFKVNRLLPTCMSTKSLSTKVHMIEVCKRSTKLFSVKQIYVVANCSKHTRSNTQCNNKIY